MKLKHLLESDLKQQAKKLFLELQGRFAEGAIGEHLELKLAEQSASLGRDALLAMTLIGHGPIDIAENIIELDQEGSDIRCRLKFRQKDTRLALIHAGTGDATSAERFYKGICGIIIGHVYTGHAPYTCYEELAEWKRVICNDHLYEKHRGALRHDSLEKGMLLCGGYNSGNSGANLFEVLGFTDDDKAYGESGVKFSSVKELLKAKGVRSLKELEELQSRRVGDNEYGHGSYLVMKMLDSGDEGPWSYLCEGRWSRGSGAESYKFIQLKRVV